MATAGSWGESVRMRLRRRRGERRAFRRDLQWQTASSDRRTGSRCRKAVDSRRSVRRCRPGGERSPRPGVPPPPPPHNPQWRVPGGPASPTHTSLTTPQRWAEAFPPGTWDSSPSLWVLLIPRLLPGSPPAELLGGVCWRGQGAGKGWRGEKGVGGCSLASPDTCSWGYFLPSGSRHGDLAVPTRLSWAGCVCGLFWGSLLWLPIWPPSRVSDELGRLPICSGPDFMCTLLVTLT